VVAEFKPESDEEKFEVMNFLDERLRHCNSGVLQCVAVCCSVLQCVAVCCSVLQCVVLYCSVLQCVAVCCSVLMGKI